MMEELLTAPTIVEPEYRKVKLSKGYTHDGEYTSDTVSIVQVDDINDEYRKHVRAFVQLGDNQDYKFWVPVFADDTYTNKWTDKDVDSAIQAFFTGLANA